jgi:hypothetical protein
MSPEFPSSSGAFIDDSDEWEILFSSSGYMRDSDETEIHSGIEILEGPRGGREVWDVFA